MHICTNFLEMSFKIPKKTKTKIQSHHVSLLFLLPFAFSSSASHWFPYLLFCFGKKSCCMSGSVSKEQKVLQWQLKIWLLNNSVWDQTWQFCLCRNTSESRSNISHCQERAISKWNFHTLKWAHCLLSTIWVGSISMCGLKSPSLKKPNKTVNIFDFRLFGSYFIFFCIWVDVVWSV